MTPPTTLAVAARLRATAVDYGRHAGAILMDEDPFAAEHVHEVRVLIKRLRSLWRAVEPGIGRTNRRHHEAALKEVHHRLEDLRDTHVMGETLRALVDYTDGEDRDAVVAVHRALFAEGARRSAVHPAPPNPVGLAQAFVRDGEAWTTTDGWSVTDLADGVRATYRLARRHARRFLADGDAIDLHDWRTVTKRLLYQLDALDHDEGVCPVRRDRLEALGSVLGKRHDLTVLLAILDEDGDLVPDRDDLARTHAVIKDRDRHLHRRCLRLHDELFRPKPTVFMAGISALFED